LRYIFWEKKIVDRKQYINYFDFGYKNRVNVIIYEIFMVDICLLYECNYVLKNFNGGLKHEIC